MSQSQRKRQLVATIAASGSLSDAVTLREQTVVAIEMPAAWTAASITLQASADGSTFNNVYTSGGDEVEYTVAASRFIPLDPDDMAGMRYVKIRSGTAATPVNQAAERNIKLVARNI